MKMQFPEWVRRNWASGDDVEYTKKLMEGLQLHTVCQSARCPNMAECWQRRTATLMVLGNTCTRNCRYCSVPSGKPEGLDAEEPRHAAEAVKQMGLRHVVVTSVTRDDLPDGGAEHIARTVTAIRTMNPRTSIEVLTPDFLGDRAAIETVLAAMPEVFGHNIETVERLYPALRGPRYAYSLGLSVLETAARYSARPIVKTALMVGHGETEAEVRQTFEDLLAAGCDAVSIGQYLRPTKKQRAVEEFVRPERFEQYQQLAYDLGFRFAVAGPFVRSSYRSDEMMDAPFALERVRAQRRASA
ncbi:MAG: lipoyl synthase [FCB group bacterium]|nr:lipoyl synthase [FCB group bacterium]